ncbi:helix-turn-helix domain-containing protein [Cystobacter fuscus]|uniref:GlxA family transcriptional regulator n=1 Tax=Cystobacter fuscus TaxID=43 RepID=UPI002B2940C8|nr:helix-turn-helix domain-containing protein [Cystobacter fuscus]
MTTIAIVASPETFIASLGAMVDAHSRLGESFSANPPLGDYAQMQTRLALVAAQGGKLSLAGGRSLEPDMSLGRLGDVRLIYLPSFQIADLDRLGDLLEKAAPLHRWLREQHRGGRLIGACGASVCHLAAAGLLNGCSAAVHPRLVTSFRHMFPAVTIDSFKPVVSADRLMTCGPDVANARLVFHMIAAAFGISVACHLFLREPATFQEPLCEVATDPLVAEAKLWMQERFARDFQIGELAALLGVSHQTLLRRFHAAGEGTPRAFVQKIRFDTAATMLVETQKTVAEIAQLVGYSDIASFREMFVQRAGMTPNQYRKRTTPIRSSVGIRDCP